MRAPEAVGSRAGVSPGTRPESRAARHSGARSPRTGGTEPHPPARAPPAEPDLPVWRQPGTNRENKRWSRDAPGIGGGLRSDRGQVPHPTPAGNLLPDGVVLLNNGSSAFVEIDRTMSYARLIAKLERYDAYRGAPSAGRGNATRPARSHWQEIYAGPLLERPFPPVLFVFAPARQRAAPDAREAVFHERAGRVGSVDARQ
ncbi:replication-relaxation family protein [Streptomyces sp. WAC01490]|uniref:replication-relaxation family protein n=1 Tax=unclassified Streptomyces TaxID=2593676 RepID=UPI003F41A18B